MSFGDFIGRGRKGALAIVKFLHLIIAVIAVFGPYFTNKLLFLSLLILYYTFNLTLWYLHGHCPLTDLEYYLDNDKHTNQSKSFLIEFLENIFGKTKNIQHTILYITTCIPLWNTFVCLIKINSPNSFFTIFNIV